MLIESEYSPNTLRAYPQGSYHEDIVFVPTGEFYMNVYTSFAEMPHDWAISAWAENKIIKFCDEDGCKSQGWNVYSVASDNKILKNHPEPRILQEEGEDWIFAEWSEEDLATVTELAYQYADYYMKTDGGENVGLDIFVEYNFFMLDWENRKNLAGLGDYSDEVILTSLGVEVWHESWVVPESSEPEEKKDELAELLEFLGTLAGDLL